MPVAPCPVFSCTCCRAPFPLTRPPGRNAERLERWFASQGWTCAPRPLCATCSRAAAWRTIAPSMLRGVAAVLMRSPGLAKVPAWALRPAAVHAMQRNLAAA